MAASEPPPAPADGVDTEEIRRALREVIASVAPESDPRSIRADRPLGEQIDLDSIDWLGLVAAIEERLQIEIAPAELSRSATLEDIVACAGAKSAGGSSGATAAPRAATAALPMSRHALDGTTISLRPIRPDDAPLEADFVRHLSEESRYKRFMRTLRELPQDKLRYFTDVDGVRHVALVATTGRDGGEVLLGVARYVVDPDGRGCEFAVAVDDAWQGKGLAGVLMKALIDTARARGLQHMEALVLAGNRRMLKFARQLGFRLERDPADPLTIRARRTL